jgi:hypothetical protein
MTRRPDQKIRQSKPAVASLERRGTVHANQVVARSRRRFDSRNNGEVGARLRAVKADFLLSHRASHIAIR